MIEIIKFIINKVNNILNANLIAFISVIMTFLIFMLGKYSEIKFKKHELKKEKYIKFIDLIKKVYLSDGKIDLNGNFKEEFFEFGSTIFIYGSRNMYKKYCFFREINGDIVKKCKYYDKEIPLYLVADMLNQIRKEIGMYDFESSLKFNSIAFFVNGIFIGPDTNYKWFKYKIKVFLIKFELFLMKLIRFNIFKSCIDIIKFPFKIINIIIKQFFLIPLGVLIVKIGLDKKINSYLEKNKYKLNIKNKKKKD